METNSETYEVVSGTTIPKIKSNKVKSLKKKSKEIKEFIIVDESEHMEPSYEMSLVNSASTHISTYHPMFENHVKHVNIIKRFIKKCSKIYNSLCNVNYNSIRINYYSIKTFDLSVRSDNDKNNKIRESIIGSIINNVIPVNYYKFSNRWAKLKDEMNNYISKLCLKNNIQKNTQKCSHKAGRKHNYDFSLIINDNHPFNIEFKFNAQNISETPQFVSPMKPSQYLESSYEEYYYDNYLILLAKEFNFLLPERNEYLHKIHSTSPKCMIEFQKKYYNGCTQSSKYTGIKEDIEFYNRAKELSEESIKTFITNNELKIDDLTEYLLKSQNNKTYMLYKNNKLHLEFINSDDYEIISYKKEPQLQRYLATTKTGIELKILLRWKNGNGIAYPAFQIS